MTDQALPPSHDLASDLDWMLREFTVKGTPQRAANEKRYLKSDLDFLGAPMPVIKDVARRFKKARPKLSRAESTALVRALWSTRTHELHAVAIELMLAYRRGLLPADMDLVEHMLRTSYTWAYVDAIAGHLVSDLVAKHPDLNGTLDRWAADPDFWLRRSALLALDRPLRTGEGDWPRFVRYADIMLDEKEFFIRKAIGWVLREVSKKRPDLVGEYLSGTRIKGEPPRAVVASGLTFKEATRQMPAAMRMDLEKLRGD